MDAPLLTDAERIRLAQEDFGFFLGWVHETDARDVFGGKAVPAKHHLEMIDLLTEETGHTLIVAPRGSAKTTILAGYVEWQLGRASISGNKNWANDHRVLWFSNTAHQAYRPSRAIKATIEFNRIYHAIFPKVKPHKSTWSQEEWKVQRPQDNDVKDPNFLALGVQGPALGARGLVVIYDDIADKDNMKTGQARQDLRDWLDEVADPILVPWGRFVMSCTRWAWNDPADWAEEQGWITLPTHPMKALIEEERDGARNDLRADSPGAVVGHGSVPVPSRLGKEGTESDAITAIGAAGELHVGAARGGLDTSAAASVAAPAVGKGVSPGNGADTRGMERHEGRDPGTGENEGPELGTAGSDAHAVARGTAEGESVDVGRFPVGRTSDSAATYRSYWPERFTVEYLLAKQAKNPRAFAKQYQNIVAPEEGMAFLREWFPRFDHLPPETLFIANSWDTAASEGRGRSFSAGWSALVTLDFHIYLFNLNRGQVLYPYLRQAVYMQAQQDHANYVIIEAKSSGKQLLDEFRLMRRQGKIQWKLEEWQPAGQKGSVTRFEYNEEVTDYCERGKVHLPSEYYLRHQVRAGLWLEEAELEIFSYPDGQTDDIVDAMCQLIYYVRRREQAAMLYALTPRDPTPWGVSYRPEDMKALV